MLEMLGNQGQYHVDSYTKYNLTIQVNLRLLGLLST